VSKVAFNPASDNVFISGSLDGEVKMWDLRSQVPLSTMKEGNKGATDLKVLAASWNGANTILSGGTGKSIHVHAIPDPSSA